MDGKFSGQIPGMRDKNMRIRKKCVNEEMFEPKHILTKKLSDENLQYENMKTQKIHRRKNSKAIKLTDEKMHDERIIRQKRLTKICARKNVGTTKKAQRKSVISPVSSFTKFMLEDITHNPEKSNQWDARYL